MAESLAIGQITEKAKIELVYNHGIYFEELEDTAYGVLAEDTNYMIRNFGKHSEITMEQIEENLALLRTIVT